MNDGDALLAIPLFLLFAILGTLSLSVTRNHRSGLRGQLVLFLSAFAIRFFLSIMLYEAGLNSIVVGEGDDSGWMGGTGLKEKWELQGLEPWELPFTLLGAFDGMHRGYSYLLAIYFCFTRVPSQLSAAVPSCFAGAMTAVLAYRIADSLFSRWVAVRAGWWTCLFPVMIIWSAQTIKEPFVVLLEMGALYGCLQLRISRFSFRHIILCGLSVVLLTTMRFYAAYVMGTVILVTLALPHFGRRKFAVGAALGVMSIVIPMLASSGSFLRHAEMAEKWDLKRIQTFRQGMAVTAKSGVGTGEDMHTSRGLSLAVGVGAVYLLLAPFPWETAGGSVRMLLTTPEAFVWWFLFFVGVLPGLRYAIRHRFGDILPIVLFLAGMGLIYSLTFGNVGAAYRQRGQMMPALLTFAALGLERRKLRRAGREDPGRRSIGWDTDRSLGASQERLSPRGTALERPIRRSPDDPIGTTSGGPPLSLPRAAAVRPPQAPGPG